MIILEGQAVDLELESTARAMPDSNTAGEVMPNFQDYHIYKHLESDKIEITDTKDKVKYCMSGLDALRVGDDDDADTTNYRYYAKQRIVDGILI